MKNSSDQLTFELINRYLKEDLNGTELIEFQERMVVDTSFSEEVKKVREEIELVEEYALRKKLNSIHNDLYSDTKKTIGLPFKFVSGIAASVIFILGFWYFQYSSEITPKELFNQNFQPYPNLLSTRNVTPDTIQWMVAMQHYSSGNYNECLEQLSKKSHSGIMESDIEFYQGICLIAINQYDPAIKKLIYSLEVNNKYNQQIKWYVSLCYLALDEPNEGLIWLKKIQFNEYAFEKSSKIIEVIENK